MSSQLKHKKCILNCLAYFKPRLIFQEHKICLIVRNSPVKVSGHAVAQLVEALRYKSEGRGFHSRCCQYFRPHCGPGVDSASNRNEYQEYILVGKGGRCVGLTTLPPSCADCLEIWEPQPPGTHRACTAL